MNAIARLSATELLTSSAELGDLLVDAVDGGASLGFLAPFDHGAATTWWEAQAPAVRDGSLIVWVARSGNRIIGTVSLELGRKPNGVHRAEVAKLIVHRDARGRGLGRDLLDVAERAAAGGGTTLLLLDTQTGSTAEQLYRAAGWSQVGVVPDYAADPAGVLRPSTFFFKTLT
ncbi:GNAT family N-acetyltransferase [Nonomuraea sp. NPDC059194]|uniref:GNAT family N-acetyltransferase n=1 Tax=Nonomuraea sp. NPDC059194 TaxID=3346764 RepID=UPI0036BE07A0